MSCLKLLREYASWENSSCITGFGHCTVGKNRFGKIPCIMATYPDLRDAGKCTSHSLRRTANLVGGHGDSHDYIQATVRIEVNNLLWRDI
jgi:hypothetical protein